MVESRDVSIAMATYNGGRHLPDQLESLANQRLRPTEIVICDDGSTDDTLAVLADFAKRAAFAVRIERNEQRLGYKRNFMKAASLCSGAYVAFCDQDDVWNTEKLERCVAALAGSTEFGVCYHDATLIDAAGSSVGTWDNPATAQMAELPFSLAQGFSIVFDRRLLGLNDLHAASLDRHVAGSVLAHDEWISFLGKVGHCFVHLRERLVGYRQHEANVVGAKQDSPTIAAAIRKGRFAPQVSELDLLLADLQARVEILDAIAQRKPALMSTESVERWRTRYAHLLVKVEERGILYRETRPLRRLLQIARMVRRGAYGDDSFSIPVRGLVKDVAFAIGTI